MNKIARHRKVSGILLRCVEPGLFAEALLHSFAEFVVQCICLFEEFLADFVVVGPLSLLRGLAYAVPQGVEQFHGLIHQVGDFVGILARRFIISVLGFR